MKTMRMTNVLNLCHLSHFGLVLLFPLSAFEARAADPAGPAAKAKAAFDRTGDVILEGKSLAEAAAFFQARTGVEVRLDPTAVGAAGFSPHTDGMVNLKLRDARYRDALRAALTPYDLRAGLVGGVMFVSSEEGLTRRQLRQRVTVEYKGTPLTAALDALAGETGANVVLDPRQRGKAKELTVELSLDDVPVETAVRLAAEVAGMRAVRLNNVLFVTSDDRAARLRAEVESAEPLPDEPVRPQPKKP
jgi:hypothetical protein